MTVYVYIYREREREREREKYENILLYHQALFFWTTDAAWETRLETAIILFAI